MSPNELARQLTRIASAIENSKNPSRELVTRDLRRVLANLDPEAAMHVSEEMHEAGFGGALSAALLALSVLYGGDASATEKNLPTISESKVASFRLKCEQAGRVVQGLSLDDIIAISEALAKYMKKGSEIHKTIDDAKKHPDMVAIEPVEGKDAAFNAAVVHLVVQVEGAGNGKLMGNGLGAMYIACDKKENQVKIERNRQSGEWMIIPPR